MTTHIVDRFPPGSEVHDIHIVKPSDNTAPEFHTFPPAINRVAVLESKQGTTDSTVLSILSVPAAEVEAAVLERARDWVELNNSAVGGVLLLTLQGAQIIWSGARLALFAADTRMEALRKSVLEAAYYALELKRLETSLNALWPQLEQDSVLAFEFSEKFIPQRERLQNIYQQVMSLRARLSQLTPGILAQYTYPPTLATQVSERLRERTRLADRVEHLGSQIEVFERVYENCGHRASEYILARKGYILEWIIILLLLTQTLLVMFELLSSTRK